MGKLKMSMLDVRCQASHLRSVLLGSRLANIYNIDSKLFVLKFSQISSSTSSESPSPSSTSSSSSSSALLVVECGIRLHLTSFHREYDKFPSNFCLKLRKHLRLLKVEDLHQLGVDRVVMVRFGRGEGAFHLIMEFYDKGNMVLTDHKFQIVATMRTVDMEGKAKESETIEREEKKEDDSAEAPTEELSLPPPIPFDASNRVAVHSIYPFHLIQSEVPKVTIDIVREIFQKEREKKEAEGKSKGEGDNIIEEESKLEANSKKEVDEKDAPSLAKSKKKGVKGHPPMAAKAKPRKPRLPPLKAILSSHLHFGPDIIDHCLLQGGVDPDAMVDEEKINEEFITKLTELLQEAPKVLERVAKDQMNGFIVVRQEGGKNVEVKKPKNKQKKEKESVGVQLVEESKSDHEVKSERKGEEKDATSPSTSSSLTEHLSSPSSLPTPSPSSSSVIVEKRPDTVDVYSEYMCCQLYQHLHPPPSSPYHSSKCRFLTFPSLDSAMDEFFSKQEGQKEEVRLLKEKAAALLKIQRVRESHQAQLDSLISLQEECVRKAQLLESNTKIVEKAIESVNVEVSKGTDWSELNALIKDEKKRGNPVAAIIYAMKLNEGRITVNLSPECRHLLPQYQNDPLYRPTKIDVDLALTVHSNAESYYQQKKKHQEKEERTVEASTKALKAAEKKTAAALKDVDVKSRIQKIRKVHWFEKFHWFITNENFIVIGGKDAQQNELIVKKHLRKGDIYIHADVHGASSVVVKNPSGGVVPPSSLSQAATMTICRSSAWKEKIQCDAYWVHHDQVSKTAPTGLFLPTGSFMVTGKRNFIPREPLVMGLGILFRVDASCVSKHAGERKPHLAAEDANQSSTPVAITLELNKKMKEEMIHNAHRKQMEIDDEFDVTSSLIFNKNAKPKPIAASLLSTASSSITQSLTHSVGTASSKTSLSDNDSKDDIDSSLPQSVTSKPSGEGKKKISAAERRKMKKLKEGGVTERGADDSDEKKVPPTLNGTSGGGDGVLSSDIRSIGSVGDSESDEDDHSSDKKTEGGDKNKPKGPAPLPRGKRTKMKRIAEKYGDQDEEDKQRAALRMGIKVTSKEKEMGKGKNKNAEGGGNDKKVPLSIPSAPPAVGQSTPSPPLPSSTDPSDPTKVCFHCKQRGHVFKSCPLRDPSAATEHSTFSQSRKQAVVAERKELKTVMDEEGIADDGDAAAVQSELDSLTGKPLQDDTLLYAMAVVAPYTAMQDYKYKVKLLPGSSKRSKASQMAIQYFITQCNASGAASTNPQMLTPSAPSRQTSSPHVTIERDLIQSIPDNELLQILLSNIKIQAAGIHEAQGRKGNKQGAAGGKGLPKVKKDESGKDEKGKDKLTED